MTHEELIDLLREARDRLSLHMEIYFSQQKGSMFLTIDLVDRIEAALAKSQRVIVKIEPSETVRPFLGRGIACPKCLTILAQDETCERCTEQPVAPPAPTKLTEEQEEWVIRLCKALLMWWQKARIALKWANEGDELPLAPDSVSDTEETTEE